MDKTHRYDNDATYDVGVKVALFMSLAALLAVVAVPLVAEQQWEPMHVAAMPAARDDPAPGYQSAERDRSAQLASPNALAQGGRFADRESYSAR